MKIHPVRAKLFHADGRTDMMKLRVNFRNFKNASKYLVLGFRLWVLHIPSQPLITIVCSGVFVCRISNRRLVGKMLLN